MKNIQQQTPLFDALLSYMKVKPFSFHVPGHKNGTVFHEKGKNIYNNLLKIDATELDGLDDLHAPDGPILEAQKLLSKLYNTKKSFFLVNGSTCGNLAMIMGNCSEQDIVFVQRNCHKSVFHAIMLAKAKPIFLQTTVNEEWGTAEGVSIQTLRKAIKTYPMAKAIILTYPSYYGIGENIEELISVAHENGLKVLVDEAHGAHFIAGKPFLNSSLNYGADFVVQSAHKTLPALTMGSFLHVNNHIDDDKMVEMYLRIFQSSSPSYPIMASLDLARSFVGTLTERDLQYTQTRIEEFKRKIDDIVGIRVLKHQTDSYDILKVTIQTDGTFTGYQLQTELQKHHIYCELADPKNILFILPILKDGQQFNYDQTIHSLALAVELLKRNNQVFKESKSLVYDLEELTELKLSFNEMNKRKKEYVAIKEAIGCICAETIIPYPPGIPFLLNGEEITHQKLEYLQEMIDLGAKFHGASKLKIKQILVYV